MSHPETELQKEFELERLILFSDAVFAIAITLLIIEIKFPEITKGATPEEVWHEFKPTAIRFVGFILSFFFTGMTWARHLALCKYLRRYNKGVIFRNLIFLFFVVCFPFSASGITEFIRPSFLLPVYIYLVNVACLSFCQYALCSYIFKSKAHLSVPGFEAEKKYMLLQSRSSAAMLLITVIVVITSSFIFKEDKSHILLSFYVLPIMVIINRRYLRKYKPATAPDYA